MRASSRVTAPARGLAVRMLGAAALVLVAGPVVAAAMADPIWVRFPSARAEPSPLALRAFQGRAMADARRPTATLHGLLVAPAGVGPFPAVVLLHDCRGIRANQRSWTNWFAQNGYVALLVDSFFARNAVNVCSRGPDRFAEQAIGGRVFDAFGALAWLSRDPRVDPRRVAVVSWGHGPAISATSDAGARRLVSRGFRAGVAIGPDCPLRGDRRSAPLLLIAPGRNAWSRPGNCRAFAGAARGQSPGVELLELPDAEYGFDDPEVGPGIALATAYNPWTSPQRGVRLRYDADAHRRGLAAASEFLHRHMALDDLLDLTSLARGYPRGHWVVDPNQAGSHLPAAGASTFDALLARFRRRGYRSVPHPFEALVSELRQVAGVDELGGSGLKVSLVPLGRSLQRGAAAPHFFRYPRVLLTVDGESGPAPGPGGYFLKDRLFIGYQEKAATLEVISYNAVMGRFEFQVVEGYDAAALPRVRYANRTLCVSCHHNQAPIFPRAAWDETHDNLHIAQRLAKARPDLYGLRVEAAATPAARFDNATDRASELLLWNRLWGEGCSAIPARTASCRKEVIRAAMHYRLSSSNAFGEDSETFRRALLEPLRTALEERFGGVLLRSGADIPNRDPLLQSDPTRLPARMDPLTPRPVMRVMAGDERVLARDFVHGVAAQIPLADVAAVDEALRGHGDAPHRQLHLRCQLEKRGSPGHAALVRVRCGDGVAPSLVLVLDVERERLVRGRISALRLAGEPTQERIRVFALDAEAPVRAGEALELGLEQPHGRLSVRLGNGDRIASLRLRWPAGDDQDRRTPIARFFVASAQLTLVSDVQPLHRIIADLHSPVVAAAGASVLSAPVFSGLRTALALRQGLGLAARSVCCEAGPGTIPEHDAGATPGMHADVSGSEKRAGTRNLDPQVARFRQACGQCHSGPTVSPPGFLFGDDRKVAHQLRNCAERIYLRLAMWQLPPEERARSPMPPASVARPLALADLRQQAAAYMGHADPAAPALRELRQGRYESSRACLDDVTGSTSR